jgi:hypothetical protein
LDPDAYVLDVYRVNPHAEWVIKPQPSLWNTPSVLAVTMCYMPRRSCTWWGEPRLPWLFVPVPIWMVLPGRWGLQFCQWKLWKRSWLTIWAEFSHHLSLIRGRTMWSPSKKSQWNMELQPLLVSWLCGRNELCPLPGHKHFFMKPGPPNTRIKRDLFFLYLCYIYIHWLFKKRMPEIALISALKRNPDLLSKGNGFLCET